MQQKVIHTYIEVARHIKRQRHERKGRMREKICSGKRDERHTYIEAARGKACKA